MNYIISLTLVVTAFAFGTAAQNRSVYTSSRTNACRTIESNPNDAGSYLGECKGPAGYKVQIAEGDLRQTLNIITPGKKKHELEFWQFYGAFSSIGERLEWRTDRGVPIALIARYLVANIEDSSRNTSYLMVTKISRTRSCVTDIVPPGPKQNEIARKLADANASKPCKPAS